MSDGADPKSPVTHTVTVGVSGSRLRVFWLTLYYLAILIAIIVLHGRGGLETPKFIYQGF